MTAQFFSDVIVNGERIPRVIVAAEAQNHPAPENKPGLAWRRAARAVALRAVLLQEARRRNLKPETTETSPGKFETEEEALIRALLDDAIAGYVPSDQEIREEWQRDPARFRAPPVWEASHILVSCKPLDPAANEAAKARAQVIANLVTRDPASFPRLATEESHCSSKSNGGYLGQITPGDTAPAFEAALRHLSEGEITPTPIPTRHGWHVVRLDAVAGGRELPFDAVRDNIKVAIEKAAWARAAKKFLSDLAAAAQISGADLAMK